MAAPSEQTQPQRPAIFHSGDRHTLGPGCQLAPLPQRQDNAWLEGMPPNHAQFFYSSIIPIDDPLSTNTNDPKLVKLPLRPYSQADNNALDKAWLQLSSDNDKENHEAARCSRSPGPGLVRSNEDRLQIIARALAARHRLKHLQEGVLGQDAVTTVRATLQGATTSIPVCCDQLAVDIEAELYSFFCPVAVKRQAALSVDKMTQRVMVAVNGASGKKASRSDNILLLATSSVHMGANSSPSPNSPLPSSSQQDCPPSLNSELATASLGEEATRSSSLIANSAQAVDAAEAAEISNANSSSTAPISAPISVPAPIRVSVLDDGISRKPFIRADMPSASIQGTASPVSLSRTFDTKRPRYKKPAGASNGGNHSEMHLLYSSSPSQELQKDMSTADERDQQEVKETLRSDAETCSSLLESLKTSAEVAVGISRLHIVDLHSLQMKPIYWSPVNDISIVQRATWFYRDTMMPLEPPVANQLESLYRELRPWSDTWQVELRCAIDLGPVGEEKISQPLWPTPIQRKSKTRVDKGLPEPKISSDPYCASHCHCGAAAAVGTIHPPAAPGTDENVMNGDGESAFNPATATKSFANYHVAFKDGKSAFLLKPSLKPSSYYGRRPISKISKGATVGIPIIRGFDRHAWERIHGQGARKRASSSNHGPVSAISDVPNDTGGRLACPGCQADKSRNQVSDLVLVIHGVGQKLAERVESFHFTHAVNGLRRAMSVELKAPAVQSILRDDHKGIMVLPVNWRHTLSFEDGGFSEAADQAAPSSSGFFELRDIEPTSIPAVRSMISDVMFDIPFYMSHHKPKMISSLIREANRVYRLWCQNNPGFSETGRVHLIGHSLGSAMAIEVLSKQPTTIPRLIPSPTAPETCFFEFDTKNLFLLGSPVAFFLLLERGALMPRRDRQKPGVDAHDNLDSRVAGEAGAFGCLAVDNIYNILAKEDPIAYLLNGTIDTAYASSLKAAYVPSASVGLFASIGQSLRGIVSGAPPTPRPADASLSVPPATPAIVRLPSQLELEVHDFTREEIAERKAHLLNDNGQVDYYLHSTGGPLEIQYLNMLSAHTSYWTNQDLIRMLCVEIGRRPGKAHAMPAMKAVKSLKRVIPGANYP